MESTISRILLLMAVIFLYGCASPGVSKSDYHSRMAKINLGMTKLEFKKIFPESIPRGAKLYPNGTVEVIEVSYAYFSYFPSGNTNRNFWTGMEGQPQWFYFYENQLIQYGNPEDWPNEPDLIIEKRLR